MLDVKLINTAGDIEFASFMDIDISPSGRIETIDGTAKLSQQLKKILLTALQKNGYGSEIRDFLGDNVTLYRELEVIVRDALNAYIKFQKNSLQTFLDSEIIKSIDLIQVSSKLLKVFIVCKITTGEGRRLIEIAI